MDERRGWAKPTPPIWLFHREKKCRAKQNRMNINIVDAMNTVSISAPTSCWACRAANESRVVQLEIQFIVTFIGYASAAAAPTGVPQ